MLLCSPALLNLPPLRLDCSWGSETVTDGNSLSKDDEARHHILQFSLLLMRNIMMNMLKVTAIGRSVLGLIVEALTFMLSYLQICRPANEESIAKSNCAHMVIFSPHRFVTLQSPNPQNILIFPHASFNA